MVYSKHTYVLGEITIAEKLNYGAWGMNVHFRSWSVEEGLDVQACQCTK
jgi:hypothetical protein